jgi:RNA polymerase sigma factor (sigma-70 family)
LVASRRGSREQAARRDGALATISAPPKMRYGDAEMPIEEGEARHARPAASPHRDPTSGDDAAILAAVGGGDHRRALQLIDDHHGDAMYRYVRNLMGSDDLADDAYQATMLAAYRDLGSFAGRSAIRTWLFGIARHRCLDALKADRRRSARFTAGADATDAADAAPVADQQLSRSQLVAALERCLDELDPELRMIVLLRFDDGFGYDELERLTRLRAVTLRARVSRAMPVLRRCIEGAS